MRRDVPKNVKIFAFFFAEICKICSREDDFLVDFEKCLKNAYLDAKIGFDPAENEPPKE